MERSGESTGYRQMISLQSNILWWGLIHLMIKFIAMFVFGLLLQGCRDGSGSRSNKAELEVEREIISYSLGDGFDAVRNMANTDLSISGAPAMSIAIYKDGEIVFAEAFGSKVSGQSEEVDEDTLFQMGSTTKMYTVLATLRMLENNSLTVDDKLMDLFPGIEVADNKKSGWEAVGLHHLMSHQTGFRDFVDWTGSASSLQDFARTTFPANSGQMNPAGEFWNYSNPNWAYLGAILEHQTDRDFSQLMEEDVFIPLEMMRTTIEKSSVLADGNYALGSGTIRRSGSHINGSAAVIDEIHNSLFDEPAGIYTWSTPTEMLKMADFLMHGNTDILSDELRNEMTSPQIDLQVTVPVDYGYGLNISEGFRDGFGDGSRWYPMKLWFHGGNTLAYSSMYWVLPEANVAVSILSSGAGTDFRATMLEALEAVITLPTSEAIPEQPVATELFSNHVGRYEGAWGTVDITTNGSQLFQDVPSFNSSGRVYKTELEAIGGSMFFSNIDGINNTITFIPLVEGGESVYIRNRTFVGIRNDDAIPR